MAKLGVAVIGAGMLGRRHAENLRSKIAGAQLVAVCDASLQRAKEVAAELEVECATDRIEEILGRKDVQAVAIATPSKFHAGQTEASAQAGKHVFCEKPMALTLADADAALAAVRRAGVELQIGFMRRYDPGYAAAKERIEAGEIGDPVIFKSVGRDRQPPPVSFFEGGVNGSLFSDSAIHDFDLARWMMRDEVATVHTFAGLLACPELARFGDVDATLVNLRFTRGGIGNVESYRKSSYGYDIRTEVLGTKGAVHVGYLQHTPFQVLTQSGIRHDVVDHWLARFADAYLAEVRDFVHSVQSGAPVKVGGEDGRRALAAALAAEQSYHQSLPVTLAPDASFAGGHSA
ncbi:MAG: Gfo/Idh/MocA family oxidoreductase [Acidobacteriota bacterium]|nr:Gfo/Idh/MocA family oxidoreductase [Acidobacteriota bacterium]